jgi:hypothetical protein
MIEKTVKLQDLVDTVEIARRLGVRDHNVVNNWRRRHSAFPKPAVTLRAGRVWLWPEIARWAAATGRLPVASDSVLGHDQPALKTTTL